MIAQAPAPFSAPILLDDEGYAWIPNAFGPSTYQILPVCEGASLGWAPIPEIGKTLLVIAGGTPMTPTSEVVAVALSQNGLRRLVRDLDAIALQMEAA